MSLTYRPVPENYVPEHTRDAHRDGCKSNPPSGCLWCWQTWEGGPWSYYWIRNKVGQWFMAKEALEITQ